MRVRPPAVAGSFYPGDPGRLAHTVDQLLADTGPPPAEPLPRALVVPHAGYDYSGPVAASAYRLLHGRAEVRQVVLLGPAHFVSLEHVAVSPAVAWATPLGEVPVDAGLRDLVTQSRDVADDDAPHAFEHALEVQLPFLQRTLAPGFTVLPLAVGRTAPEEVADVIDAVTGDERTLVVVSTDLSHYHDQRTAQRLDRRTADAVLARDPGGIGPEDACGRYALAGLLAHARRHDHAVGLLDLRTSGDTAGDPTRVVGYGAFTVAAA